jgi:acyl-CoA thioester hydrolase
MSSELLNTFPVHYRAAIAWGDMDAFQHVNNVVYLRYFESARIRYFEQTPIFDVMKAEGVGPIVHSHRIRYRLPLTYPDTIEIGVRIAGVGADRILAVYRMVSTRHQRIAAEGDTTIVFLNYRTQQKAPIPGPVLVALDALEGLQPHARPQLDAPG